jgi:hypothetical protein
MISDSGSSRTIQNLTRLFEYPSLVLISSNGNAGKSIDSNPHNKMPGLGVSANYENVIISFSIRQRIHNPAYKKDRIGGGLSDNIHE